MTRTTFDDVLAEAARDGREITLVFPEEKYGWAFEIDGERLVDGFPRETFDWPIDKITFKSEGEDVVDELLDLRRERARRRRRRREEDRTATHRAAEGATLAHGGAP